MNSRNQAIKYLDAQSRAIACLVPKVSHSLGGKSVHRLRVATRRARAVLWVLKHSSAHLQAKGLDQDLQKLCKALGKVRELDVAILDAKRFGIDSARLKSRRKIVQKKLGKLIKLEQGGNLVGQLSATEKTAAASDPLLLDEARSILNIRLNRQLKRHIHGQTKLHHLRIVMRKARYALEAMGKSISSMKPLQDALGAAHDLELLQLFTEKSLKLKTKQHSISRKAVRLAKPAIHFAVSKLKS